MKIRNLSDINVYVENKEEVTEVTVFFSDVSGRKRTVIEYTPSLLEESAPGYWERILSRDIEKRYVRGEFEDATDLTEPV